MERESSGRVEAGRLSVGSRLFIAVFAVSLIAAFANAANALALSPSVSTLAAANVADTTATLNGSINPNGLETKTYFEYGPTTSYGSKTAEVNVGSGSSTIEKAQAISGLSANTTYHYRVVATNSSGTSQGADRTFTVGWVVQTPVSLGKEVTGNFQDVSCSSATECTAVGATEEQAIVQRWNGTEWKSQTPAKPAEAVKTAFDGVSCPSSSTCYAVGKYTKAAGKWLTLVETWNGTEWKVQTSPSNAEATQSFLESVSCSSTSECTAVGYFSNAEEADKTLALRWNGTEWSLQTTANPASNHILLTSVSCPSSSFCMATGFYLETPPNEMAPFSERWNGTEWAIKAAKKPAEATLSWFFGVSCTSSTACTAAGAKETNAITHETKAMAQRWNGTEWSLQTTPSTEGAELEDVSCTSSTACTAVGYAGSENPLEMRWDGSTWTLFTMPLPSGGHSVWPFAVSCIASRGCESVGLYVLVGAITVYPLAEGRWRSAAPTTTTTAASEVGEKSATLKGTVNPNGSETKVYFEYGTTTSYGSKTAEFNVGSGTSAVEQGTAVSGLNPATTYHYRIVGNNENPETSKGGDQTFRTTAPPSVLTSAGEPEATGEAATLRGWVNPNGLSTTYQFEYGTSPGSYTNIVPVPAESAGSGTETKFVSYTVTGLTRGKTYYYRITASNVAGTSNGSEVSFTTPNVPGAATGSASEVTRKCGTLAGTVEPHGLTTKYWFEYGTTTSYGTKIPVTPKELSSGTTSKVVEETPCGLSSGTLYHYRLVAENSLGTTNGSDQTLTTLAAVTLSVKGIPLKSAASLKVFSSNLTFFIGETTHGCTENELTGEVSENPGALEAVTAPKMQNSGGAKCSYVPGLSLTIQYSFPSKGTTLEYTTNKAGEGIAKTSKFVLLGTVYFGAAKSGECEWNAELSGTYKFKTPLELSLSGQTELIRSTTGFCFSSETMSGTFTVTSSGSAVEAS